ncbi:hypothetical protein [Poseidonocella sp. HB161398]|uniref:hypothetical protein n=1 Tax=Poseidonocella sp. HB161398 TaxID=2320855 RepID=UPI00110804FE|nr:hypothetical protein [Poseidonocella sp. HB161398]
MMYEDKFTLAKVVEVLEAEPRAVQTWWNKHLPGGAVVGGGSPGKRKTCDFPALMHMATAKALIDGFGINATRAFEMAVEFAHFGAADEEEPEMVRYPSLPYREEWHDPTLLVVTPKGSKVVRKSNFANTVKPRDHMNISDAGGVLALNVSEVFNSLVAKIEPGRDPQEILAETYGN